MKKLALIIAFAAITMTTFGQDTITNTPVDTTKIQLVATAEVGIASVNMLPMTGLALEKNAASINGQAYIGANYNKVGIGITVISQKSLTGSETTYNFIDITENYRPTESLSITAGYELTIWDHTEGNDEVGHNLIGIVNWNKNRISVTGIMLADIRFSSIYLITSANYKLTDHVDVVGLIGYATTMGNYEMLGIKCTYQKFNLGVYGLINNSTGIGVTASYSIF